MPPRTVHHQAMNFTIVKAGSASERLQDDPFVVDEFVRVDR